MLPQFSPLIRSLVVTVNLGAQLLDLFAALEEQNLFLIQSSQETEEQLEELRIKYRETKARAPHTHHTQPHTHTVRASTHKGACLGRS